MLGNAASIPYESVYKNSPNGILLVDVDRTILHLNPAEMHFIGNNADEIIGLPADKFIIKTDRKRFASALDNAMQSIEAEVEIELERADGTTIPVWRKIHAHYMAEQLQGYIIHTIDIREKRHLIQQLKRRAETDLLTKLFNRRAFVKKGEIMLRYASRYNGQVALLFIDLDNFKLINDNYGHEAGDAILKTVAQRIFSCIRETDMAARLGGDEFVIMLCGDRIDTRTFADRLYKSLIQPIDTGEVKMNDHGASIGIALYPDDGESLDAVLSHADAAMYEAKKNNTHRISYYHASSDAS